MNIYEQLQFCFRAMYGACSHASYTQILANLQKDIELSQMLTS